MNHALQVSLLGIAFAFTCLGCTKDSELVSSCQYPGMKDGSRACLDVTHGSKDKAKQKCAIVGGIMPTRWEENSLCDQSTALGGCKSSSGDIMWYFSSEKHKSSTDVESDCKGTFVP